MLCIPLLQPAGLLPALLPELQPCPCWMHCSLAQHIRACAQPSARLGADGGIWQEAVAVAIARALIIGGAEGDQVLKACAVAISSYGCAKIQPVLVCASPADCSSPCMHAGSDSDAMLQWHRQMRWPWAAALPLPLRFPKWRLCSSVWLARLRKPQPLPQPLQLHQAARHQALPLPLPPPRHPPVRPVPGLLLCYCVSSADSVRAACRRTQAAGSQHLSRSSTSNA